MAPQVNATHRCLHEQLLAVEAARGTLVLDVLNAPGAERQMEEEAERQ